MAEPKIEEAYPGTLVPGDLLLIYIASMPIWTSILQVIVSPNGKDIFVEVDGNFPEPQKGRLPHNRLVTAIRTNKRTNASTYVGEFTWIGRLKTSLVKEKPVIVHDYYEPPPRVEFKGNEPKQDYDPNPNVGFISDTSLDEFFGRGRFAAKKKKKKRTKRAPKPKVKPSSLIAHFRTLGLKVSTPLPKINKKFRKLAFKYHPDKNPGNKKAAARFKKINTAYQELSKVLKK